MRHSKKESAESATGKLPEVHGEIVPWEGGLPAGRRATEPMPSQGNDGADIMIRRNEPKVVRVRRSLLVWLICLLAVAALAIVGLVRYLPAHKNTASAVATTNASASATTTESATASASASQPNPAQSAASTAPSTAASAGASDGSSPATGSSPIPTTSAVAATGGGAGAPIADLSALNPVTTSDVSTPATGPQQIGATTYEDSVRFTCYSSSGSVIYDVAGYKYLTTLIGIPSNASNGAGNAMTITFYKDGSATQLSSPVTVTLDHPQSIHLNLQGSSQLEIACSAINTSNQQTAYMDVALGNATIGPN